MRSIAIGERIIHLNDPERSAWHSPVKSSSNAVMAFTIGPRLVPTEMRDKELSNGTRIRYVPGTVPLSSRTLAHWHKRLKMPKGTFSHQPVTLGRCL